jgi:hypothetical protein
MSNALLSRIQNSIEQQLTFKTINGTLKRIVKAQQLFNEIINEEVINHEIYVEAIFNIIEILIMELKILGNENALPKIHQLTAKLEEVGKKQNIYSLLVKTYLFQGKLALLEPDIDKAKSLFEKSSQIANEKGYEKLGTIVLRELKRLEGDLPEWLLEKETSVLNRLENIYLEGLVVSLKNNRVESFSEEKVRVPDLNELSLFAKTLKERSITW